MSESQFVTSLVESAIQTQVAVQFFANQLVVSPQDKVDSLKKKIMVSLHHNKRG